MVRTGRSGDFSTDAPLIRHGFRRIRPSSTAVAMMAHLTIVFAALAVSRRIEHQTGWSIRTFIKTARRYRTIEIQAGQHAITAAAPLPADLRIALDQIHGRPAAH
jgi:hypothetical protein